MKAYRPYRTYNQLDQDLLSEPFEELIGCSQDDLDEAKLLNWRTFGRNASGNNPQEEIK